jgi:hypothetical protein
MRATGRRVNVGPSGGQQAQPFIGIQRGDAAIGDVKRLAMKLLEDAFLKEWQEAD